MIQERNDSADKNMEFKPSSLKSLPTFEQSDRGDEFEEEPTASPDSKIIVPIAIDSSEIDHQHARINSSQLEQSSANIHGY